MSKTTTAVPDHAEGIEAIRKLAVAAAKAEIVEFDTINLDDASLPKRLPVVLGTDGKTYALPKAYLDDYRLRPQRVEGTATAETLESFIALTNRHKLPVSAIFARTRYPDVSLATVINYFSEESSPGWADHHIRYTFPLTEEFKAWVKGNGEAMEQADFAAFLEEHAAEVANPSDAERAEYERLFGARFAIGTELIELSRGLEISVGRKMKSTIRLSSGERQVEFVEEHSNAKGEPVIVPGLFMVSVPAFVDGSPVRIPARLRYRAGSGGVVWFYQLYRWQHWLTKAVQEDLATATKETGLPGFEGAPEA